MDVKALEREAILISIQGIDLHKLTQEIKDFAADGGDFGCSCYYCGATPIDLVERGDAIAMMYGDGIKMKIFCFRCSDEASCGMVSRFITDPAKEKECLERFSRS